MATHKIIISGFGGQGVMLMGTMLAYAGVMEEKEVTWLPSYGPEMRGGTANCSVIISDRPISAPTITKATCVAAMNTPSLIKFEGLVTKGGMLFVNSSLIDHEITRDDIDRFEIPANDLAKSLQNERTANMIMLGAIVLKTGVVKMETIIKVTRKIFSGSKKNLLLINLTALEVGQKEVQKTIV
ncbi:MAG TPA: 2-oxoacid:acceptor oxidoreductase family protein [Anaerovoracaceae bacterium]|nr:2-oxoacid:acceptor oxidoreductase family protein [Anaerovoracaceae bacterium]